jgi:acyl carrier protein
LYLDLIERLAQEGISVFVEVGPRQVLTRLNRRILANRDAIIIASDNPKRPGIEQLVRVQAALESAGVPIGDGNTTEQKQSMVTTGATHRDLVQEPIVHFDATVRRKQSLRKAAQQPVSTSTQRLSAAGGKVADELELFLINFVCDQTGYPAELVTLDADLEADLGIDSIKKAQLFGELREHFDIKVASAGGFSLDDYPTLRHVMEFLKAENANSPVDASKQSALQVDSKPTQIDSGLFVNGSSPVFSQIEAAESPSGLRLIHCVGTPYEMGLQHGRFEEERINKLLEPYEGILTKLTTLAALREAIEKAADYFTAVGLEELRGVADALGRPIEHLIAYNLGIGAFNRGVAVDLGLCPEHVVGCAQFAITAKHNGNEGMIHGVNEDWPLSLGSKECLTRIVQARYPTVGIPHITFGLSGQLGTLNGINARGIAISSASLLDRQRWSTSQGGNFHSVIVKVILENAIDIESAMDCVRRAERIGGWSLCISHHLTDRICYLEYDGPSLRVQNGQNVVMTTNHCMLHPSLSEMPEHSDCRLRRLQSLLRREDGQVSFTVGRAKAALRDLYDMAHQREMSHPTMNTIRRIDNQVSIVMHPELGELWVTPGPLAKDQANSYHRLDLKELFARAAPNGSPQSERIDVVGSGSVGLSLHDEPHATPDRNGRIRRRFVLRTIDAPLGNVTRTAPHFSGPVLIVGENRTGLALRERLEELGATVIAIRIHDASDALDAIDRIWTTNPAPHLFLVTARDEDSQCRMDDNSWWEHRRRTGLIVPYLVCQHWTRLVTKLGNVNQATLVAATALGGDFGLSGRFGAVEGGALAGLLKGIRREFPGMLVKIIDTPIEEPSERVAAAVCAELVAATCDIEVGYVRGKRYLVRALPRSTNWLNQREIPSGGTWVVTGGARGVTAIVARELAQRFGLSLHLIGTSPAPNVNAEWRSLSEAGLRKLKSSIYRETRQLGGDPMTEWSKVEKAIEIDKALQAFREAEVNAAYYSCDVSNRGALDRVLKQVRRYRTSRSL